MTTDSDYKNIPKLQKIEDLFRLDEKVAVIIGGTGKMGHQFGSTLSYAGAKVGIVDLDESKCIEIAKEITLKTGNMTFGIKADASNEKEVKEVFNRINNKLGKIRILIYSVMSKPEGYYRPLEKYPLKTWKTVFDGNLIGAFVCCRQAHKYMKAAGGGSIVLTSSIYGLVGPDPRIYRSCSAEANIYGSKDPLNTPASYVASKAGLIGLARYLATAWRKEKIRVNVLTPGGVYDGQEESFHYEYINRTPMARMGVWSDFNGAILFLASEASRYMTGANLVIDGGWTAW